VAEIPNRHQMEVSIISASSMEVPMYNNRMRIYKNVNYRTRAVFEMIRTLPPASTLETQRHRVDLSRKHDTSLCLCASVASIYQIMYGVLILKNALVFQKQAVGFPVIPGCCSGKAPEHTTEMSEVVESGSVQNFKDREFRITKKNT
jgi:hypothetical protein